MDVRRRKLEARRREMTSRPREMAARGREIASRLGQMDPRWMREGSSGLTGCVLPFAGGSSGFTRGSLSPTGRALGGVRSWIAPRPMIRRHRLFRTPSSADGTPGCEPGAFRLTKRRGLCNALRVAKPIA